MGKFINNRAFRWLNGEASPVFLSDGVNDHDLIGLDDKKELLYKNMESFVRGGPALNTLLWGDKGAGKSTLIRMIARDFSDRGLRIVEFCSKDYHEIYNLYTIIRERQELKFVIYFDDVSFNDNDENYRNFKSIVEGGIEEKPNNSLFMATSNRRHLIAESSMDIKDVPYSDVYQRDQQNENTSLFARFGLTIGFYPLQQDQYLEIVRYYMDKMGIQLDEWEQLSINYAMERGGRSGRVALQFVLLQQILKIEL